MQVLGWEDYVAQVVQRARNTLSKEPWFRGVCTHYLQQYYDGGTSVEDATDLVVSETEYWDNPAMWSRDDTES
jgi:hypothetical protein